jgi:hypothetical protein
MLKKQIVSEAAKGALFLRRHEICIIDNCSCSFSRVLDPRGCSYSVFG